VNSKTSRTARGCSPPPSSAFVIVRLQLCGEIVPVGPTPIVPVKPAALSGVRTPSTSRKILE
jgi:hypothetical protein